MRLGLALTAAKLGNTELARRCLERTLELADDLKKLRVVADDAPTLSMPKMPKLPDGIPSLPKLPSLPDSFKGPFN